MKFRIAICAAVLGVFNLVSVTPASASCHEVIEDGGCIENWLCPIGDRFGWQCIE